MIFFSYTVLRTRSGTRFFSFIAAERERVLKNQKKNRVLITF